MKSDEMRKLSDEQVSSQLLELRKEQMNLRFQKATGTLENPNRWREVRKNIARLKTEVTARAATSAQAAS